jgi:long-chain acyl-CoA synthetase
MVISGGVNIYPAEIEAMLMTLPGVADCAVFGIPDPEYGEALAAHVQPQPGAVLDGEDVRDFLRRRLANYKVPRMVEFSAALPREDSGKIFKRKLREPYWRGVGRRI